jgi:GGDEF domain-containing protein
MNQMAVIMAEIACEGAVCDRLGEAEEALAAARRNATQAKELAGGDQLFLQALEDEFAPAEAAALKAIAAASNRGSRPTGRSCNVGADTRRDS